MKTVKFISNDSHQKEFGTEVRKNVNNYFREKGISKKGNAMMFVKAIIMLSIYIVPFVFILTTPMNIWLVVLLVILMGVGEAGIGMSVMHDAAHGAFSSKQWVNNLFASTIYLLGSNTFNWKVQHNIFHHSFTNIYGYDEDIETKAVIRLCRHAPLKKFHRFQHVYAFFFYGLMTLSKLVTDFGQLVKFNKAGLTKEQGRKPPLEIVKLIIAKAIYVSIIIGLPLLLTDFIWWQILVGFAILHITAGMIMSTVFQMAHVVEGTEQPLPEEGVIKNTWAVHELLTTSDFARNNLFLNWYIGGLNFQIEHHLFTNICHIHYRKMAPIVEQTARDFGLTYNLKPTLIDAFTSHIRRLRALGRQQGNEEHTLLF
ncbi:fatty acid desaturase family protein [Mariniflexile sp. HMF6888]|uniref:fatty acid desaturase family protein n=1 Tax=Mariniflexile sp. HMF6888 TaxID=3373086 RepID=UPI0037B68D45